MDLDISIIVVSRGIALRDIRVPYSKENIERLDKISYLNKINDRCYLTQNDKNNLRLLKVKVREMRQIDFIQSINKK